MNESKAVEIAPAIANINSFQFFPKHTFDVHLPNY